ncbi:MAG: hypothetical protein ABIO88_12450 [Burkholderiaceae bacterium]
MNISKIASKAERAAIESRFARINWNAHLVPIVREIVSEFENELKSEGYSAPHLSLLSEAVSCGEIVLDQSNHLGDSITIQFGVRPIATNSLAPIGTRPPILVEKRAAIVFSQAAASGVVMVLMYPPSSENSTPTQPHYLIDTYQNPSSLTRSRVRKLLRDLFEIDFCCSTQTAPSAASGKLMVKLEARAKAIQSGSAGVFAYVKYIGYLARGLWHLYKASHASP